MINLLLPMMLSLAMQRTDSLNNNNNNRVLRCDLINQRIDERVSNHTEDIKLRQGIYHNIQVRLQNLIDKADAAGLDTTKLKADLVILNGKVKVLQDALAVYIAALKDTKSYTCGTSQGKFMEKLGTAKTESLAVRNAILDIRNFYKNTIRPDMLALKAQIKPLNSTGDATDEK